MAERVDSNAAQAEIWSTGVSQQSVSPGTISASKTPPSSNTPVTSGTGASGRSTAKNGSRTPDGKSSRAGSLEPLEKILPGELASSRGMIARGGSDGWTAESLWSALSQRIRTEVDDAFYQAWFAALTPLSLDFSASRYTLALETSNKFAADHLASSYGSLLSEMGKQFVSERDSDDELVVKFVAQHPNTSRAKKNTERTPIASPEIQVSTNRRSRSNDGTNSNPRYTFGNFIVGSCNQLAHAVGLQVSESLGTKYNPLFVYGGVGLGKTHLVNAIGNAAIRKGKKALMISSEAFVNELIASLRSNRMQQFKSKFRSLDLLIIDDVQFIMGKERTQEGFFHTFNDLHQRHKQIIVTSDKLPQELTGLEERLRTRFASGLSADISAPDFETRVAILTKKAALYEAQFPLEVAQFLASKIDTNVRELEGALNRLMALCSVRECPVSMDLAEHAVRGYFPERRREISPVFIQNMVAERYSVTLNDILGKRRTQNIAFARQVAMFLCRKHTGCSYPEIGALFGGRDHSTVIHAHRVIDERQGGNGQFKSDLEALSKKITSNV